MSIKQKVLMGVAGAMIIASSLAMPTSVFAAPGDVDIAPMSDVDSGYYFGFDGWFQRANTAYRSKDTSSSTYLRVDSRSGATMRLYVDGATNSGGANYANLTIGGYVTSPGPGRYEIHNNVYETGRRWARLGASSDNGPGTLGGVWSPDCSGNYTDLN